MEHIGVLTKEIISFLNIKSTGKYLDCTLGSGDHSINVLRKLSSDGELWCIDIYKKAIKQFKKKYKEEICKKNIFFINDNFINIKKYVSEKKFDGIIADIGLSYDLINDPEYSLSYNKDSILNMNYLNTDKHLQFILNKYSREKLVKIFFKYGNEKYSKSISKNICKIRKDKKIINNYDLIKIIKMSTPANYFYKNMPQKRIFQALRIYINDELENLKKILKIGSNLLNNGGKFLIISFNSWRGPYNKEIYM